MKLLRSSVPLLMAAGLGLAGLPAEAQTCVANTPANPGFTTSFRNDANLDLGDYGLIFKDAKVRACSQAAAVSLLAKVQSTLAAPNRNQWDPPKTQIVGPYQGWLEGAHVALIFASALEIGGQGDLTTTLDTELIKVRDKYKNNPYPYGLDPYCGFDGQKGYGNGCMDDYTVGAMAYAWIAAYEKHRGRDATPYLYNGASASHAIHAALSATSRLSICIYNPSNPLSTGTGGPCNGTVADLRNGFAQTVSLNHGQQSSAYGLGLVSLIAGAYAGIEQAQGAVPLSADEKLIALEVFEEAQRTTDNAGDANFNNCHVFIPDYNTGSVTHLTNALCWENYKPKMYPVRRFYTQYIGTPPSGGFGFDYVGDSTFNSFFADNPVPGNFFNAGRQVSYGDLGYKWLSSSTRPPLSGQLDDYNPIGYLDGIDAQGCAWGWSCDPDKPATSLQVDFYVDGFMTYIQSTIADGGSEPAVSSLCGGGTAHRFRTCLPAWTKGRLIYAYGLDATGRGFTNLPGYACAHHPACTW